jgi:hypothetical protein
MVWAYLKVVFSDTIFQIFRPPLLDKVIQNESFRSSKQNSERVFFHEMLHNKIPTGCIYFCSTVQNSDLFSLRRNGSEQNFKSLLLFLLHDTEYQAFSSSAE